MSVNHCYSEFPKAAAEGWWSNSATESPSPNRDRGFLVPAGGIFCLQTTTAAAPPFAFNLNLSNDEDEEPENNNDAVAEEEWLRDREMLFEKPLTPSDVGKLNRLVIPKQHAERNFPMNCGGDSCENGVLLNFVDEIGKTWRFRYSYWNSSQSYVLTKGWSRFVKEKRLDAGDVVTFSRHRASTGRLFIGWRRRNQNAAVSGDGRGWNREISGQSKNPGPSTGSSPVPHHQAITGNSSFKTLRLFGVNLEFHGGDTQTPTPMDSPNSGQANSYYQYYSNHMDMISFSGETRRGDKMWGTEVSICGLYFSS